MSDYQVEVVFSFDTTGSMYPCLTQVRRKVKTTVERLMKEIPGIRIGIIAHGDYCDKNSTYVTKHLGLTADVKAIVSFIEKVGATGGGDAPECYELVLHEAQSLSWLPGTKKCFVLIGDDVPHAPSANPQKLNWRDEVDKLGNMGIPVYGVQCLNRGHATKFYQELAHKSGGFHVGLDQFSYITELVTAICFKQSSDEKLQGYEQEIIKEGRMNRGLNKMFEAMQANFEGIPRTLARCYPRVILGLRWDFVGLGNRQPGRRPKPFLWERRQRSPAARPMRIPGRHFALGRFADLCRA